MTRRLLLFCLLAIPAGCASSSGSGALGGTPLVRVQVLGAQERVMVAATAPPAIRSTAEPSWRRINFPVAGAVPVVRDGGRWRVGNIEFPEGELLIQPQTVGSVSVNGQSYRGRYRFVATAANRFDVVNDVDIEGYLMGVVSKEVLPEWDLETFKAQAVAARTYALYEMRTSSNGQHFDLFDDTRSQVYGGFLGESPKSRQAVSETAGIVVAYGPRGSEKIFKAYFSSCCGGVGQSAYEAFADPEIPPLAAKRTGTLCSAAKYFTWSPLVVSKSELTRRMKVWAVQSGKNNPVRGMELLQDIQVAQVNDAGRPVRFVITDVNNRRYSLGGEDFRHACNADAGTSPTLRSTLTKPVAVGDTIQFTQGHGWGHGVGMCQWCAQSLAVQGKTHEQILRFSYPGAVLVRAY